MRDIVLEWIKIIEANSTTFYDSKIISKSVQPRASAEIFPGGARRNFRYIFQVADDALQIDVHKTLYLSSLCWLLVELQSQCFVWNVFYTSAIRNAFFHKLPNIHFWALLQISHNFMYNQRLEQLERWKKQES